MGCICNVRVKDKVEGKVLLKEGEFGASLQDLELVRAVFSAEYVSK